MQVGDEHAMGHDPGGPITFKDGLHKQVITIAL